MDTSSAKSRDHLLQSIDDEMKSSEENSHTSKCHHSALVPISCLPPEILIAIFSFMSPSISDEKVGYLSLIWVTHVCRQWREIALNYPNLWSYINFTKLTPAGITGILARTKMSPLYLEARITRRNKALIDNFERQLKTHLSHIRHLSISGRFQAVLDRLVSPAPALETLSLSDSSFPFVSSLSAVPDGLFHGTTPKLKCLKLGSFGINWKSPLLKGLRTLQVWNFIDPPTLEDWLDALIEIAQLETLILHSVTPIFSVDYRPISEPRRILTLPSLTQFKIGGPAKDCALALAHLVLPLITSLNVAAQSDDENGEDIRQLIPYIVRNAHGPQDTAPLQSALFSGKVMRAEIVAWTVPDADVEVCEPITLLGAPSSTRLVFSATGFDWDRDGMEVTIFDALLTHLPVDAISTLTAQNYTLTKEFWLNHGPKLAMLKRARLVHAAVRAFREMLDEGDPPDGPLRLPRLTKLILANVSLTALRAYYLRDTLVKRRNQGAPLEVLDLRACIAAERAIELLAETVDDVQGPAKMPEAGALAFFDWKGGVDSFDEAEKYADQLQYDNPWNGNTGDGEDEDEEDGDIMDDYDYDDDDDYDDVDVYDYDDDDDDGSYSDDDDYDTVYTYHGPPD